MLKVIKKSLGHKYFPIAIAIIAFLVSLHTINDGLMLDDLVHRTFLISPDRLPEEIYKTGMAPEAPGRLSTALFNTFGFVRGKETHDLCRNYGILPWWSPKDFKVSMWRPLASFTHWLDYRFFPDNAKLMHIHHLLWYSGVIFLIAVFYRRLMGPTWVAAFAVIMFLIDENNIFPVMFNAHRNSIIALFFGLLCFLCHFKWRKDKSPVAAAAAPFFLLLSLLSAEAGIATFAFILAYAVALENGSIKKRIVTIVPSVCVIVVWRLVYNYLGYGFENVGIYIDPINEPVHFTLSLFERFPIMMFGVFSPIPADFAYSMSRSARIWLITFSLVSLLLLLLVMLPLLRKSKLALFFFLSTVFAVIPFCACFVSSRNLLFAGVASFGLIAVFVTEVFKKAKYLPKNLLYKSVIWICCIGLFLVHLPGALLGKVIGTRVNNSVLPGMGEPGTIVEDITKDKNLVIINTPCVLSLIFAPFYQAYNGKDVPNSIRMLVPGLRDIQIKRTDERTLVIASEQGDFFNCGDIGPMNMVYVFKTFNDLFINKKCGFQLGRKFALPQLTVEILSVDEESMPTEVSFVFNMPLEDDSLCFYWYDWQSFGHKEFELPGVGQTIEVPGPPYVDLKGVYNFFKRQITKS